MNDLFDLTNIKYQRSKNNYRCLGPCYKKGVQSIHPITLQTIDYKKSSYCPTIEWYDQFNVRRNFDECEKVSDDQTDQTIDIIMPMMDFRDELFLRYYYEINNFYDMINWYNNNNDASILTIERLLSCSWKSYGQNLDYLTDELIDLQLSVAKERWINYLYSEIGKYLHIKNKAIIIGKPNKNNSNENDKKKYIISKFLVPGLMHKFLKKYIVQNKKNWYDISLHMENMKKQYLIYIVSKINATITK